MSSRDGLEPPTQRLTAPCSTGWATEKETTGKIGLEPMTGDFEDHCSTTKLLTQTFKKSSLERIGIRTQDP